MMRPRARSSLEVFRRSNMTLERSSSVEAFDEGSSHLSLMYVVTKMDPNDKERMIERGHVVRGEMANRIMGNIWGGLGKPVHAPDDANIVLAIRIDPERTQDYRCLLQAGKSEIKKGANNVLLRDLDKYDGCKLYVSKDGMAGLGVTDHGTIISVFKAGPRTPKPEPANPGEPQPVIRHRLPDLIRAAVHDGGGHHLACLAHLAPLYARYGFDVTGVVPLPPEITTPGWDGTDAEDFAAEMEFWQVPQVANDKSETVKLPLVIMRLNRERFAEFDASPGNKAKVVQPMDPSVFDGTPRFTSALAGYAAAYDMHQLEESERTKAVAA